MLRKEHNRQRSRFVDGKGSRQRHSRPSTQLCAATCDGLAPTLHVDTIEILSGVMDRPCCRMAADCGRRATLGMVDSDLVACRRRPRSLQTDSPHRRRRTLCNQSQPHLSLVQAGLCGHLVDRAHGLADRIPAVWNRPTVLGHHRPRGEIPGKGARRRVPEVQGQGPVVGPSKPRVARRGLRRPERPLRTPIPNGRTRSHTN